MKIRVVAAPTLSGAALDAVRLIARTPLGQRVNERRQLIGDLLDQGFTRTDVRQQLRMTHAELVEEIRQRPPRPQGNGFGVGAPRLGIT